MFLVFSPLKRFGDCVIVTRTARAPPLYGARLAARTCAGCGHIDSRNANLRVRRTQTQEKRSLRVADPAKKIQPKVRGTTRPITTFHTFRQICLPEQTLKREALMTSCLTVTGRPLHPPTLPKKAGARRPLLPTATTRLALVSSSMSPKLLSSWRSAGVSMLFSRRVVVGRGRLTPRAATAAWAAAWADSMPPKVVAGAGRAAVGLPEVNLTSTKEREAARVSIVGWVRSGYVDAFGHSRERTTHPVRDGLLNHAPDFAVKWTNYNGELHPFGCK